MRGRCDADVGIVDADADRTDTALSPPFLQNLERTRDGFSKALIDLCAVVGGVEIMDKYRVKVRHPQALEAPLEALHRSGVAVFDPQSRMASTGHEPTRLGREHDRAPRFVRKEQTHPALPLSGTIQWRGIVGPDAFLPGSRE